MGIATIKISNYKSIKKMQLNLDSPNVFDLYCMLGKNGSGKSTVIDAIRYFYKISNNSFEIEEAIDKSNIYVQKMCIEIVFDFSNLLTNNRNEYLDKLLQNCNQYFVDNKLLLRMTQYKNGQIIWYPLNDVYFVRKILKIFPIFIVNTRFISLTDWSELWNIISEISISEFKEPTDLLEEKLINVFESTYGEKYAKSIQKIKNVFDEENIKINDQDYLIRFKTAIMTVLGGDTFLTDDNSLLYYSDGMNSLNYIKLLLKLIVDLSDTAWKNSLIILDEPEIGLHPKFVEDLADLFSINKSKKVSYLITTHSTHFVSSILKNEISICFYRLYLKDRYTKIEKIRNINTEPTNAFLINDAEAESYFSDAIVFVEGQTEIQLLKHRKLINLFPFLKRITIYNTNSTDTVTRLILPRYANITVPYINILDMDKILKYNTKTQNFSINPSAINPFTYSRILEKQNYLFYNKKNREKSKTYNERIKIRKILKNKKFIQDKYYIKDKDYKSLLKKIKAYCSRNNVFVTSTTIEGVIVNEHNSSIVLQWLKDEKLGNDIYNELDNLLNMEPNCIEYATTILRLIFNGKLDNLKKLDQSNDPEHIFNKLKSINNCIGKKTSGWLLEFLDYYFKSFFEEDPQLNKENFKKYFPELFTLLQMMENLLQ
jgi:predicted ATP-dependent endonuclease of OLD family